MNVDKMTLPYPVLGINDDVLPRPEISEIKLTSEDDCYTFSFDAICKNEKINQLVNDGFAKFVCEVACSRTFMRECHTQKEPHFEITVPKQRVVGRVDFEVTITVVKPISAYTNAQFHEDYAGFSFNLEPGDLLGYISHFYYDVDIKYDKLNAVGSFMEINKNPSGNDTRIELGHDKISILLPNTMYEEYRRYVSNNRKVASVIHASIVFNALIEALYNIEDYEQYLWARTIVFRLNSDNKLMQFKGIEDSQIVNKDKVFDLAQALLGDPYKRLFTCLQELSSSDDDLLD